MERPSYHLDEMKLRPILVTFGCWLFGCIVAQARIGETEKQCDERYGKPVAIDERKSTRQYFKADLNVITRFRDGKCDLIMFRKLDDAAQKDVSENERELLLTANGAGREWKKSTDSTDREFRFETADSEFGAIYFKVTRILMILNREAFSEFEKRAFAEEQAKGEEEKADAIKAEAARKLRGF